MTVRRIAHLDMDAFYASVELLRYPELRGLPVVIGGSSATRPTVSPEGVRLYSRLGDYAGRGVITTATYEARALGVHSAMGLMKAAKRAPEAILLPADFSRYKVFSRRFKEAVATIAPHIEDRGIDEIYIDLSLHTEESHAIGRALRQAVYEATGLSCSIGISPNKLLSKIASDLDKPGGLTVIGEGDLQRRIWPLPVGRINGIGPKAQARLQALGVETVGQLAAMSVAALSAGFGERYGRWLHEVAHGRDDRPVVTESVPKSMSRETTFERDLHLLRDRPALDALLDQLCERVANDLQRRQMGGRTVGVKVRFDDFRVLTRDHTLSGLICDAASIREAALQCLGRIQPARRIRLIGVRVSGLQGWSGNGTDASGPPTDRQLSLFS